ncbi:hypothetical protein Mapa_015077 [Marchantia paleacea]|nr:hypothetical protein Mapa_015077 [Marchantia paleacea]
MPKHQREISAVKNGKHEDIAVTLPHDVNHVSSLNDKNDHESYVPGLLFLHPVFWYSSQLHSKQPC